VIKVYEFTFFQNEDLEALRLKILRDL
jgi:hypothetical protein